MKSESTVKGRSVCWVNWVLLTLLFVGVPSFVQADINDFLLEFHPYITAEEEYTTNVFLSPNANKIDDWITTVTPGLRFTRIRPGAYGIDLDVNGGYNYYAKNHDLSYWSAAGRVSAWYAVTPNLTFRVRDYLVRSDAARENIYDSQSLYDAQGNFIGGTQPDRFLLATQRGVQAIYLRNVVEPMVEYRFGRENLASLLYRNNVYSNKNRLFEDSTENTINPMLNYWFNIRNGITLEYLLTFGNFEVSDDLVSHGARGRYTHRIDPKLSFFGEYSFIRLNFKGDSTDYDVHRPSLGLDYKFSPTLTGTAQGGYYWQLLDDDSETTGPFFLLSLVQTAQKTSYALTVEGGYTQDYFTSQNLGFAKYIRAYGTVNHKLTPRMDIRVTGSMERPSYDDGRKEWIWDGRISASYLLFRWLTVALEGAHREAHSNADGQGYSEYSGIFRITATLN